LAATDVVRYDPLADAEAVGSAIIAVEPAADAVRRHLPTGGRSSRPALARASGRRYDGVPPPTG